MGRRSIFNRLLGRFPRTEFILKGAVGENIITPILIDVISSETHSFSSSISENPVEDGSFLNDHINNMNKHIAITGIISDAHLRLNRESITTLASNTAIGAASNLDFVQSNRGANVATAIPLITAALLTRDNKDTLETYYTVFNSVFENRIPFSVVFNFKTVEDAFFSSFTINRSSNTGRAVSFSATISKLRIVKKEFVQTVTVRQERKKIQRGRQAKRSVTPNNETPALEENTTLNQIGERALDLVFGPQG